MAEIKVRPATINDLEKIQNLNLKLFEKEHKEFDDTLDLKWTLGKEGKDYFERRITEDDGCVLVAYNNDEITGYLSGGLHTERIPYRVLPKLAELENMFVADEYRNAGIGTKLYEAFVSWCKQKDVGRLRVIASAKNTKGIGFYKKNGFTDYEVILETSI